MYALSKVRRAVLVAFVAIPVGCAAILLCMKMLPALQEAGRTTTMLNDLVSSIAFVPTVSDVSVGGLIFMALLLAVYLLRRDFQKENILQAINERLTKIQPLQRVGGSSSRTYRELFGRATTTVTRTGMNEYTVRSTAKNAFGTDVRSMNIVEVYPASFASSDGASLGVMRDFYGTLLSSKKTLKKGQQQEAV